MPAAHVRLAMSSTEEWVGDTAEKLVVGEGLTTADLSQIIKRAVALLRLESSLLELNECRVVSKLYGSLDDLLAVFRQFGWPSNTTYVFLGNYLCLDANNRVETRVLLMLLLFKIVYPSNILLLRGITECEFCATEMGLMDVCFEQFSGHIYEELVLLFKFLPLAALSGGAYFMSCGSLSLSRGYLIDYEVVNRPRTTCSKANRLAYLPQRLSMETLRRFREWDHEKEGEDFRNLSLFLRWNALKVVVKSSSVDLVSRNSPLVEGPGNSLVSFQSASAVEEHKAVNGCVMAIHKNLCCTFHLVRKGAGQLTVRMLAPNASAKSDPDL